MPTRSYIKIYGPPVLEAFKILSIIPLGELELTVNSTRGIRGERDWFFEWTNKDPDHMQYMRLIELLDEYLAPINVWYTIETLKS